MPTENTVPNTPPPPPPAKAQDNVGASDTAEQLRRQLEDYKSQMQAKDAQLQEYNNQLKEITGAESLQALKDQSLRDRGAFEKLAEQYRVERDAAIERSNSMLVQSSLIAAAVEASAIDPSVVHGLLASRAKVKNDGMVVIDGKSVSDAVKALLHAKPFLAKATPNQGSGAAVADPNASGTETEVDRFAKRIANLHKPQQRAQS